MLVVIFLGGTTVFLRIAGKSAKIRHRKNFVPHGIASLSKLCLFCRQLVAIFAENNNKKNRPVSRRKAPADLKFFLIACNTTELI